MTEDPKGYLIFEDLKKDHPITEGPKQDPITEPLKKDPITDDPK